MQGMSVSIRAARRDDAGAIAEIYNQGVEDGQATFETEPRTAGDFTEDLAAPEAPPFLVAEDGGRVVGWARLRPYSPRPCYAGVGEASLYVGRAARGEGIGLRLMEELADEAGHRRYWKLIGLLFPENRPSVALCRAAGWREVGLFHRHGRLEGRWRDVLLMERLVGEAVQASS
jgi:L-amino acid N-acyltransferase YncA